MRSTTAITTAIAAIACAASVHALGEPATEPMMLGGWSDKPVTDEHVKTLRTALSGGSKHYAARVGPTRVCFTDVARVETQVVSGTNYRFYIDGCAVPKPKLAGKCSTRSNKANSCASPTRYVIRVYEQTWTDTLQVESITQGDTEVLNADAPPPPAAAAALNADDSSDDSTAASTEELSTVATMSDAEKRAVDDWIAAEGRNAFGDTKDTYYLGGTPLFDESTGKTIDKYVYIARRHPTRPWKQATPQATLRANMLAAAVESTTTADAAKRNNGGAQGLLSVIAGVGVLTMVLAVVAGVKAKRSTRRYAAYDQVARREI